MVPYIKENECILNICWSWYVHPPFEYCYSWLFTAYLSRSLSFRMRHLHVLSVSGVPYSGKVWWGKIWRIGHLEVFARKSFGECRWFTGRRSLISWLYTDAEPRVSKFVLCLIHGCDSRQWNCGTQWTIWIWQLHRMVHKTFQNFPNSPNFPRNKLSRYTVMHYFINVLASNQFNSVN